MERKEGRKEGRKGREERVRGREGGSREKGRNEQNQKEIPKFHKELFISNQ